MATKHETTGLTFRDLEEMFPEDDKVIRELIDGELFVTPSPTFRHQQIALRLGAELHNYTKEHGGAAVMAPVGVYLDDKNFVEPDVLFLRADHLDRVQGAYVRAAPDLVIEVSSPSTRKRDVTKKRELYERFGVAEYWFVDLDADRVEVYRLDEGRYGSPTLLMRGDTLVCEQTPGFSIAVDELLGPPED